MEKYEEQSDSVIIEKFSWHWPGGTEVNRKTLNESSRWPTGDKNQTPRKYHSKSSLLRPVNILGGPMQKRNDITYIHLVVNSWDRKFSFIIGFIRKFCSRLFLGTTSITIRALINEPHTAQKYRVWCFHGAT